MELCHNYMTNLQFKAAVLWYDIFITKMTLNLSYNEDDTSYSL